MARTKTGQPSVGIRVPADIAEMISWLARLSPENESIPEIVDGILRTTVEERFAAIRDRVETIKAAESGYDLGEAGA